MRSCAGCGLKTTREFKSARSTALEAAMAMVVTASLGGAGGIVFGGERAAKGVFTSSD